tara:strand:- start:69 stop:584 length:516 start_codon:yes stop_codon:yes gene_type:complete
MILKSLKTIDLTDENIKEICKLKNTHWKFGIKSQLEFFYNFYKPFDLHICLSIKNKIIGYNCLRKRKLLISKERIPFLLFDTLVISKKYRGKKLGNLIMTFNNNTILNQNLMAILLCNKNLLNFYSSLGWTRLKKEKYNFLNVNKLKELMIYNDIGLSIKKNKNNKIELIY